MTVRQIAFYIQAVEMGTIDPAVLSGIWTLD